MAKLKAQTLQSRFGMADADLKTSLHDEIMFWVDDNLKKITEAIINTEPVTLTYNDEHKIDYEFSEIVSCKGEWERPITSGPNKFMIGFVDMFIRAKMEYERKTYTEELLPWSKPWMETYLKDVMIALEVKTTIPSLGELMRQINMYRKLMSNAVVFAVVCPDDRFKDKLKEQDIFFVKYPEGER